MMSVVFTGSFSGTFISNGAAKFIPLPSGVDFMRVENETVSYAAGAGTGAEFFWRQGMAVGQGTIYVKTASTNALQVGQIAANNGFFFQDTSLQIPGAVVTLTGITGATPPVVLTGNTSGLNPGDVVRIYNTVGAVQLGGLDFTIGDIVPSTSFQLSYMSPIAAASPGAGTFRKIPFDPIYYPRRRTITNITPSGSSGVPAGITRITLSVTHGYTIGQEVRFTVPTINSTSFGMTQLNGLQAPIVDVFEPDSLSYTNTIDVAIDSSLFTPFSFPLTTSPGFTPAQVTPIGENTAVALINPFNPLLSQQDILADATINEAQFGMLLMAGTLSPAGVSGNVISWQAYKSFNQ